MKLLKISEEAFCHVKPNQDIVLSKWIGMEGSVIIAERKEEELLTRFPKAMIKNLKNLKPLCDTSIEAALAVKSGVSGMCEVSSGGIYGALYLLSKTAGVGLNIDLRCISMKQETVELCEYFGLNPYYLKSDGCMLMVCDNGLNLVRELEKAGIHSSVIGRTTSGKAKEIVRSGEVFYLERPKKEELNKLFKGEAL